MLNKTYAALIFIITGILHGSSRLITNCDQLGEYYYTRHHRHHLHDSRGFVKFNTTRYHRNDENVEPRFIICATSEGACSHPGTAAILNRTIYQPQAILKSSQISMRLEDGSVRHETVQVPSTFICTVAEEGPEF